MTQTLDPLPGCDLPIFWQAQNAYTLFYAPGCVVTAAPEAAQAIADAITGCAPLLPWADKLRQSAARAVERLRQQQQAPFAPECLTLYLHNQCNLECVYCYADPQYQPGEHLHPEAIAAAADLVAANCQAKGLPLTTVFHGGGEPTLFQPEVERALAIIEQAARRYGLGQFRYIATNGALSETKARWIAARFNLIGLSCDGPPDIQDRQRPRHGGGKTSALVERTAAVLHEVERPFHVRVTITPETAPRQAEIAAYLCHQLSPQEIHFEPIYFGGRTDDHSAFSAQDAPAFVTSFLEAQSVADEYDIPLTCSGSRLSDIHGPFCHIFRQVLNLVPANTASVCFKLTRASSVAEVGGQIGRGGSASFVLDQTRIDALREKLSTFPPVCSSCFNRYHCSHGCPDSCPLSDACSDSPAQGFRCQVQRVLAYHQVILTADRLWRSCQYTNETVIGSTELAPM